MTNAIAWAMFVVGVLAFAAAWLALSWADSRVREATRMYEQSQCALDRALSKYIEADAMLMLSRDILKWAERYEFGAAMRAAGDLRKEEAKQ